MSGNNKELRTWHYTQEPSVFEIAPCKCGCARTQWSEFSKHLWCPDCQIDFIPEHGGIFDGPIPVGALSLMGISLDRFNMETGQYERFDADNNLYIPEPAPPQTPQEE